MRNFKTGINAMDAEEIIEQIGKSIGDMSSAEAIEFLEEISSHCNVHVYCLREEEDEQ